MNRNCGGMLVMKYGMLQMKKNMAHYRRRQKWHVTDEEKYCMVQMKWSNQYGMLQMKRNLGQMEVENEQLKSKVEHLNEDIRNLGNVNTTLEKRLEMEKASVRISVQPTACLKTLLFFHSNCPWNLLLNWFWSLMWKHFGGVPREVKHLST